MGCGSSAKAPPKDPPWNGLEEELDGVVPLRESQAEVDPAMEAVPLPGMVEDVQAAEPSKPSSEAEKQADTGSHAPVHSEASPAPAVPKVEAELHASQRLSPQAEKPGDMGSQPPVHTEASPASAEPKAEAELHASQRLSPQAEKPGDMGSQPPVYTEASPAFAEPKAEAELHASQRLSPQAVSVDPELGW
ncbi:unnamed protein product [Effrenium voratum]|nr:unnamed protein product [Effrenium voratum]